ncbi:hypothetical protein MACK_000815 [Theileria orientalis]|uniref:Uncharacterized protein n=1 Tax=Theileria orientalis TaxID=68886 RepID=A0A976QSE0_THEOR|nr:hypothetical protein MACK_000815 [Theileria orientalis]
MRLIHYAVFLFCSFGAKLVKAGPTLDLDTYDPEEFNLVLGRETNYNTEKFTPKSNDEITRVTASGTELYTSETSDTVSSVKVYSVKSVPQLVEINLSVSNTTVRFLKNGNEYQQVDVSNFIQKVNNMSDGTFTANFDFTLNLESKFTPRNLFTKKEDLVDGVKTYVFAPVSEPHMTLVKEGPLTVATAATGEHFTKVTVSLKGSHMSLALVESTQNNTPHAYYFQKQHSWKPIDKQEYERLLDGLHPVDVYAKVTLDISAPDNQHFQEQRDFDAGLTETVYNPLTGYEVTKVTSGSTELWSSNENRSSRVVVYSVRDGVKLVKVQVKNAGGTTDVLLSEDGGAFITVNQQEFSDRLQNLRNQPRHGRSSGPATLDVASPNTNEFQVVQRSFKGVHYKEFSRTNGMSIPKVESSGAVVFDPPSSVAVTHVNAYLKLGVPTLYQVSGVESGNVPFNTLLKLDHGNAVAVDSREFQDFLATATRPPSLHTKLGLDLDSPEQDNVAVYSSKVYGLDNTVAQAHDGYFFDEVNVGGTSLWTAGAHPGVSLTQVVAFKNATGELKLLELEGFHDGNYVSFYYEHVGGEWKHVDQPTFQSKFRVLKLSGAAMKPSQGSGAEQTPDFLFPAELPGASEELPGPAPTLAPSKELELVDLDTENIDDTKVSMIAGSDQGYYFKSFAPQNDVYFGSVRGPSGFEFNGNGLRLVTLVKFFWVHSKLVGANLFTDSVYGQSPLVYYYTYEGGKWEYSLNMTRLAELLANETAYTNEQKADLEHLEKQTEKLRKTLEKLKEAELKEVEKRRKQEEEENKAVVPKKLSHKTRLFDEMADLDQHPPPKAPEAVEETEEELNKRRHSYAGGDKILVESELLYFELSNPKTNDFVHTKDYTCMGLSSIDVTPFAGRYLHVVSLHGKRVWVSSNNRRATNMQLFYADDQIVGALLKVTSVVRGTTVTGEEFDYLFVKDGELQKVSVSDFMNLSNIRFQSAALVNLSKGRQTQ